MTADHKNNFVSLVSIIKIEPEEFQTSEKCLFSYSDEILRRKAQIFSDPVVFLERATLKKQTETSNRRKNKIKQQSSRILKLVKKENAGKTALEPHNCSLCGKVFGRRDALKKHIMNIHGKGTELSCDLCPKTFRVKNQMIQHMRSHMKKTFACNICDYKTAYRHNFVKHKETHLKLERCKICNKQVASLKDHLRNHKKEACPICKKVISKQSLIAHMKLVHDDKRCKCSDCSSTFSTKKALRRHKLEHHYEGKLFRCHCGSVFKTNRNLKSHQLVHESKKPTCEVCGWKFALLQGLKRHYRNQHLKSLGPMQIEIDYKIPKVLSHNGKFVCDKCGTILRNRASFISHFRYNHIKKPNLSCDLCPKLFKQKSLLEDHLHSHLKINPFTCEVCGHKSSTKRNFKTHMLIHGQKTECKVCHKMVTNIYEHMKTHVKVKCPICAITVTKPWLPSHLKRKHSSKK